MSAVRPTVAAVVVTADSGPSLQACVQQLMGQAELAELWIVDNASSDGIPAAVAAQWADDPRLHYLPQARNLGFGAAVNLAAATAGQEYLLIVNPDGLLPDGALSPLLASLQADSQAGVVGALICDADGQVDPASRRHDPLLARALATLAGRSVHGVAVSGGWPLEVQTCDAISGALMLLPVAAFRAVGGFDQGYFLHCEDLDLCRRLRDHGYRVLLHGAVRVIHGKGSSSRHRPVFVSWHKHRGMWRWFRHHDPAAAKPWWRGAVGMGLALHFVALIPAQMLAGWRWRHRPIEAELETDG